VPVEQAGKIWRITGIKSIKGEGGNFKLDMNIDGQASHFTRLSQGDPQHCISLSPSLCFNSHFPGEPGLAGVY